jgi:protein phosphatase 2C family protein 2/3
LILGPFRVLPGRLSVSRTFGDIEAKKAKYGGNIKVIIAEPEIKVFKVLESYDFILLACKFKLVISNFIHLGDGVFDKLTSKDVVDVSWDAARKHCKSNL